MKTKILLIFFCSLLFTNCSLDNDNPTSDETQTFIYEWHLVEVIGGLAAIDHQFDLGVVIWVFDDKDTDDASDDTLTIENDNTDNDKEDFLDSGTYSYMISEENSYLTINGTEYGQLTFPSASILTLDTNELSTGSGADGFTYTFQRVVVAED